jgi:purine catabolism regulator
MLSVRDVLGDLDVRLLAGERSLDVPVRWVHISELHDPTPFLAGGELLLTTGMALDSEAGQREYLARLADHGLAGLGVGTGFKHAEVPRALVEAARERDFPLFEVPYELPFIAITEQAFARLVNEQYALLQRSIAAQERLQRIVLGERGLEAIVSALAGLIGGAALVFDGRGDLEVQRTFRRDLDPAAVRGLGDELRERVRRGESRGFVPHGPELAPRALALPVGGRDVPAGPAAHDAVPQAWLVAVKDAGGLGGDRPADPPAGGHRRGARAPAPARRRLDRAAPGRRSAQRRHRRRPRGRGAGPAARSVRARRTRVGAGARAAPHAAGGRRGAGARRRRRGGHG